MEQSYVTFIENVYIDGAHTYKTIEYIVPHNCGSYNYCYEQEENYDMECLSHHHHPIHMPIPSILTAQAPVIPTRNVRPTFTSIPYRWHCHPPTNLTNAVPISPYVIETDLSPQYSIYEPKGNSMYDINLQRVMMMDAAPSLPLPPMTEFVYHTVEPCADILSNMVLLMESDDDEEIEIEIHHYCDNDDMNENIDDCKIEADNGIVHDDEYESENQNVSGNENGRGNRKRKTNRNVYRAEEGYLVEEPSDEPPKDNNDDV